MKILIKQKPWIDSDCDEVGENFTCKAVLSTDESATTTEVCKMLYKALMIEGYHIKSIAQGMYNMAQYLAEENEFELKPYGEEESLWGEDDETQYCTEEEVDF